MQTKMDHFCKNSDGILAEEVLRDINKINIINGKISNQLKQMRTTLTARNKEIMLKNQSIRPNR